MCQSGLLIVLLYRVNFFFFLNSNISIKLLKFQVFPNVAIKDESAGQVFKIFRRLEIQGG